ncbi:MAG: hypothetical protein ACK54L_01665, partial [Betaproteobacteria bacterium]
ARNADRSAGLQAESVMLPDSACTSVFSVAARQGFAALRAAARRAPLTRSMPGQGVRLETHTTPPVDFGGKSFQRG